MRRRAVSQDVPIAVLNGGDFVHTEKCAFAVEHLAAGSDDAPAHEQSRGRPGEEQRRSGRKQQQACRDRERRPNHALRDLAVPCDRLQPGEERARREQLRVRALVEGGHAPVSGDEQHRRAGAPRQRPASDFAMRSA